MKFKKYINRFNKEEILKLNKEGNNLTQIAKIIDIPYRRLSEMCNHFNVQIVKNFSIPVNHNYFTNVDTEVKAYILGYIIADGCIRINKRKNSYSKRLTFCSSIKDEEIINLIRNQISSQSKITKIHNTKGAKNRLPQLVLRITSKEIVNDLINKYDIKPNKALESKDFSLPVTNSNLTRHLIRGIFDGDGNVCKGNINFCLNSKHLCEDIVSEIKKQIPEITYRIYEIKGKTCKYYKLYINTGKGVMLKLYNYLYKDSEKHLTRKKDVFEKLLNFNTEITI
jgi:hypothetical protein